MTQFSKPPSKGKRLDEVCSITKLSRATVKELLKTGWIFQEASSGLQAFVWPNHVR